MSGVQSVRELIDFIKRSPDQCNYTGGVSEEDIARAETELAVTFPPAYRLFLAELGSCEAGGVELLGIFRTPSRGNQLLGSMSETLDSRRDFGFPPELIAVEYDGMGGIVSLNSSEQNSSGEYPVVVWDPGTEARGGAERLADDFGSYALRRCRGSVR